MTFSGPDRQINLATVKDEALNNSEMKAYVGTPGGPYTIDQGQQNSDIYNALTEDGPVPVFVIKNYVDLNTHNRPANAIILQISENVRRLSTRSNPYTEIASDLIKAHFSIPVFKGRKTRHDKEIFKFRNVRRYRLCETISEIGLAFISANIGEGQDGYG